eukprot:15448505-Alexandrium_andersonii.AAC.1
MGWLIKGVPHAFGDSWCVEAKGHASHIEVTRFVRNIPNSRTTAKLSAKGSGSWPPPPSTTAA